MPKSSKPRKKMSKAKRDRLHPPPQEEVKGVFSDQLAALKQMFADQLKAIKEARK